MDNVDIKDAGLEKVGSVLSEQIELCHSAARALYNSFCTLETREEQEEVLQSMTRVIQASASAASALNRVKGTQIHQTITVLRAKEKAAGASPDFPKTNSGVPD